METWVWSLGREDPLEKEMATTTVFLPGESCGQRNLAGYTVHRVTESNRSEQMNMHAQIKTEKIF